MYSNTTKTHKKLIQNCSTKVYGWIFRHFCVTLNENQVLRAQQNQEGGTDMYRLLSRYTSFWQKCDVLLQNPQTRVYRWFFAILRYIERKSAIEGTKTRDGDTDIYRLLSRYTWYQFMAIIRCLNSKLPNKGMPWILRHFTVHWTKISYWGRNKTQEGDTDIPGTVYCHGTSCWHKIRCLFLFWLCF